jgi:hypothetical protein
VAIFFFNRLTYLFKLLEIYTDHINSFHNNKFRILPNPLVHLPIEKPSAELLKLVDMEKKDIVTPDEHQVEALDGIVDRIRHYGFYPNWRLGLFYPYKGNSWNNSVKMSVLAMYIKDLIEFKDFDLIGFSLRYRAKKYYALDECTCPTDDASLFIANILFVLCTNTSKEILQESMSEINNSANIIRIRNAIAHGHIRIRKANNIDDTVIIFKDIYNGEVTFELEITVNEFSSLFNQRNVSLIAFFLNNKGTTKLGTLDIKKYIKE